MTAGARRGLRDHDMVNEGLEEGMVFALETYWPAADGAAGGAQ
jgi:hypothetical protein